MDLLSRLVALLKLKNARWRRGVLGLFILLVAGLGAAAPFIDRFDVTAGIALGTTLSFTLLVLVADHVVGTRDEVEAIRSDLREAGTRVQVFESEQSATTGQIAFVQNSELRSVRMCEYSARSVEGLLFALAASPELTSLRVLMCHPDRALSEWQRQRIVEGLRGLRLAFDLSAAGRRGLRVKCYRSAAGLRGRDFDGKLLALGWYTQDTRTDLMAKKPHIWGDRNAVLVALTQHAEGATLAGMFDTVFENLWRDGVSAAKAFRSCRSEPNFPDAAWMKAVSRSD